jgi:hypothetical protein
MLSTNAGDKMGASKIGGFNAILIISILLLAVNASAETTFFDNPDDAFIMDDFATGGVVIVGRTGGTTSVGACTYQWNCTDWSVCLPSGKQRRNCVNVGTCPDTYEPPGMEQDCTYTASPEVGEEHEEPGNETGELNETGEMGEKEIADENIIFLYSLITTLAIGMTGSIIFYSRKGYFGKPVKRTAAKGKDRRLKKEKKSASPGLPPARRNREVPAIGGPMDVRQKAEKNQILAFLISNSRYPTDSVSIIKDVTKVISRPVYVTVNKPYYALIKTLEGEGIDIQGFYFIDASSGYPEDESKDENFEKIKSADMTDIMLTIEKCLQTKRFDGVIFDSISTLLTCHDEDMVIRFTHSLINKLRKNNVKGIFMCTKEDMNTSLMKNLNMLADSSIDTERKGRK